MSSPYREALDLGFRKTVGDTALVLGHPEGPLPQPQLPFLLSLILILSPQFSSIHSFTQQMCTGPPVCWVIKLDPGDL